MDVTILTSLTVSDGVESLGTVVFDASSRSELEGLDEGLLLVLPVYFRILHNEYRQRAVPVLPVLRETTGAEEMKCVCEIN